MTMMTTTINPNTMNATKSVKEETLEKESAGTFADSVTAVILAAMLHDAGMTIARKGHELYAGVEGEDMKRYI